MTSVGMRERETQNRVIGLLRDQLEYTYLGDWTDREGNRNVEPDLLAAYLRRRGYEEDLIARAVTALDKAASDTSRSIYDRNRSVYDLLRYGIRVKRDVGENVETVWPIDWADPKENDFGVA